MLSNNFTKEELEFLAKATRYIRKQWVDFEMPNLDEYELEVKIKSMLESKCSHEKDHLSDFTVVYPCKHCGELFR